MLSDQDELCTYLYLIKTYLARNRHIQTERIRACSKYFYIKYGCSQYFTKQKHKKNIASIFSMPIALISIFLLLNHFQLCAQNNLSINYYNQANGLHHRLVNAFCQDSKGFMWLANGGRLCRFDGKDFKCWTRKEGLKTNINSGKRLIEDSEGYIWYISIGVDKKGIEQCYLVHTERDEVINFKEKFGSTLPFNIDALGREVRVGSDNSLYFYDLEKKHIIIYHHKTGFKVISSNLLPSFKLLKITKNLIWGVQGEDQNEILGINTEGTIVYQFNVDAEISIEDIFIHSNHLWYRINKKGIPYFYQIDKKQTPTYIPLDQLPASNNNIQVEAFGDAPQFVYSTKYGPYILNKQNGQSLDLMTYLQANQLLPNDYPGAVKATFEDQNGLVWIGTDFGLYIVKGHKKLFTKLLFNPNKSTGYSCRGILEFNSNIIVGLGNEISTICETSSINSGINQYPNLVINNKIPALALTKSKTGSLHIGSLLGFTSLNTFDNKTCQFKVTEKDISISPNQVWSIYEDNNSDIWLGCYNGLNIIEKGSDKIQAFKKYNQFDEVKKAQILDIQKNQAGHICLSSDRGFYMLDKGKGIIAHYWSGGQGEYYLPTDNVQHFHQDSEGIYWFATSGDGLIRWDKQEAVYRQFTTSDGLSNDNIYSVYEDDYNCLWLSTDYGITQFDKYHFKSRIFTVKDGITHNEFNKVSHYQAKDGRLFFGGLNGINVFHPSDFQIPESTVSAPLQITEFLQFDGKQNLLINKTHDLINSSKITLHPEDRFFQLSFALLNYEEINSIHYAYKVEGIDQTWTEQKESSIRLGRLPYGRHILKIKGQAANRKWSSKTLEFTLIVLKPFYFQAWFVIGVALLSILLLYSFYQYRLNRNSSIAEAKRMKDLDALKTKLYTYISHEFRTPLTVIMGMANKIKGQAQAQKIILRNSNNLLHLVNQLLDLSKLDAGNLKVNLKNADIIAYLQYLIESFYSSAEDKNLNLVFDTEEKELWMDFDELRIQQIIYNLISNAIKYTPKGGTIILSVQKIIKHQQYSHLQIRVKDSGIGISKDDLKFIFNRFHQLDNTPTKKGIGTGIGLALTKELIELMEGSITVDSEMGYGSKFIILLPIKSESERSRSDLFYDYKPVISISESQDIKSTIDQTSDFSTDLPHLLIIEDNKDVASYIRSCVEMAFQVEWVNNGALGIESAFKKIPDIIISDVMMDEKNGYEVTAVLKKDERTCHIPIILLTAKAEISDKIEGLKAGADAYLLKPFHKEELLVRLKKLLELRTQLQHYYLNLHTIEIDSKKTLNLDEVFIQKLYSFIIKNLSNPSLNVSDLCKVLTISQAQLYRKVKALTGKTPALFIRSIRLEKAKNLLQTKQLNVSEVAYQVGFSDPNYFSRTFTQKFKKPPSHFINN